MSDKEKTYREGCDESVPKNEETEKPALEAVPEPTAEVSETPVEEEVLPARDADSEEAEVSTKDVPETAFLVMRFSDGRVEAATTLPGLAVKRQADLRDIRDIAHSLFVDADTTITSKATATEVVAAQKQAIIKQQVASMMAGNKGVH
jgi:hypothetical protein